MSGVLLPLIPSVANYEFNTRLADRQYVLNVRWNMREEAWYMDVMETDNTKIASGLKLVLGTLIGVRSANPVMPGVFVVRDTSNAMIDPGFDDIGEGQRCQVYFFRYDELFTQAADPAPDDVVVSIFINAALTATLGALTGSATGTNNTMS